MDNQNTTLFFEQMEKEVGSAERTFAEQFADDVEQVYSDVMETSTDNVHLEVVADDESLSFRLEDDNEIAEYDLFSIHANGTFEADFSVSTSDYHKDTFGFEHLENNPIDWFEARFDKSEGLSFKSLRTDYDLFLKELAEWMEGFFIDVTDAAGAEGEMDTAEEEITSEPPRTESEGRARESF